MNTPTLKQQIKAVGMTIGFIENEAGLPASTLYNYINQNRTIPVKWIKPLKKVLKKYKINAEV